MKLPASRLVSLQAGPQGFGAVGSGQLQGQGFDRRLLGFELRQLGPGQGTTIKAIRRLDHRGALPLGPLQRLAGQAPGLLAGGHHPPDPLQQPIQAGLVGGCAGVTG